MNLIRATIFALLPTTVLAAGFTGPAGENKLGEEVSVVEGFVDKQGDFQSYFSVDPPSSIFIAHGRKLYKFDEECKYSGDRSGSDRFFICNVNGKSPLAGTTYEITYDYCKGGSNFVCVKGCERPEVPPNMFEPFYECDTCEERCAKQQKELNCPFTDRRGADATLIGDKVNLRSAPDTSGEIISSLSYGASVKIISQEKPCSTISGKVGRWVQVDVRDGKTILRGWIFDPYIKHAE